MWHDPHSFELPSGKVLSKKNASSITLKGCIQMLSPVLWGLVQERAQTHMAFNTRQVSTDSSWYARPRVRTGAQRQTNGSHSCALSRAGTPFWKLWYLLSLLSGPTCFQRASLTLNLSFSFFMLLYHQKHISAIAMVTLILLNCLLLWLAFSTPYFHSTYLSCLMFFAILMQDLCLIHIFILTAWIASDV